MTDTDQTTDITDTYTNDDFAEFNNEEVISTMTDTTTKARKPLPVFGVEFETPPAPRRRGRKSGLIPALEALKQSPGQWARVGVYTSPTGANSTVTAIRKGRQVPSGRFDYTARQTEDGQGSLLFAKFLGD